jgi:multidrug resistance efflux pump
MRPGSHLEAPTHLGSKDLGLPPEWLVDEELSGNEVVTSAVRGGRAVKAAAPTSYSHHSFSQQPLSAYPAPKIITERSNAAPVSVASVPSRSQSERDQEAASDAARELRRADRKARKARKAARTSDKEIENSVSKKEKSVSAPVQPEARASAVQPEARASAPVVEMGPGINAIDPLAVPVPPELGQTIYSWVRRLALQADLAGADRVLRDALLDVSSSLSCQIVYPGADGLWTLGADDEIPRDAQPLVAVATARRAVISSHSAIIPVLTTSETVAVITMTRNPRNPAYHPIEQIAMIALSREAAAILHHLAIAHLTKQTEIEADKGGLYRGEALEAHRSRGNEGVPVQLTPAWVRRTYPILGIAIAIGVVASIFLTVPTYSTGAGIVVMPGTTIASPSAGLIQKVFVKKHQAVKKGDKLLQLSSATEEAELTLAKEEFDIATKQYLLDGNDEQVKKSIANADARVTRAKAQLATRVIRALKDGTVADIRLEQGKMIQPGEKIATIVDPGVEPEINCFLPGKDRPRLHEGMELQVAIQGYTKTPEYVKITYVGSEVISGSAAANVLGTEISESLAKQLQGGNWVLVKARLPKTFKTDHDELRYHHGMTAQTEVKIKDKPFIVTVIPALEKYVPGGE